MINSAPAPGDEIKRSRFPFSPLVASDIPDRLTIAALDHGIISGSLADKKKSLRIMCDLEKRANLDARDLEYLEAKAMTYAGALGEIDALHIEWGKTDPMQVDQLWERLGRILRKAGV